MKELRDIRSIATPEAPEVQVRIGDLQVVDGSEGSRLVTVGLGSCIGVAIMDLDTGAAGLAHVFLPVPPVTGAKPGAGAGTYAVTAVPELVRQVGLVRTADAPARVRRRPRLVAVIAGGARMFATRGGAADVGERNVQAVEAALAEQGVGIVASDVGGSHGRTLRVRAGIRSAGVTVRQVGSPERELWSAEGASAARAA